MGRTAVLMVLFIWMWGKERLMTCSVSVTGHPSKRHHGCLCFWSMRLVWLLNGKLISIGMYQQKCFPPSLLFSVRYRFMDVHAVKRFGVSKIIYIYIYIYIIFLFTVFLSNKCCLGEHKGNYVHITLKIIFYFQLKYSCILANFQGNMC